MIKDEKKIREIVAKEVKNLLKEGNSDFDWSLPRSEWNKYHLKDLMDIASGELNIKAKFQTKTDENTITQTCVITDPKNLGPFAGMIKELKVQIIYACAEKDGKQTFYVFVGWKYSHPGGRSNGFDNRYVYDASKGKLTPML